MYQPIMVSKATEGVRSPGKNYIVDDDSILESSCRRRHFNTIIVRRLTASRSSPLITLLPTKCFAFDLQTSTHKSKTLRDSPVDSSSLESEHLNSIWMRRCARHSSHLSKMRSKRETSGHLFVHGRVSFLQGFFYRTKTIR